jgi:hypothetical protein
MTFLHIPANASVFIDVRQNQPPAELSVRIGFEVADEAYCLFGCDDTILLL